MPGNTAPSTIDWFLVLVGLAGGLALFLYGLDMMAKGLQAVAGERVRFVLDRLTANRFMGALTGAMSTAILNSSSITTVLVVGFVTARMMTLAQSIGVIMGANIGSTFTAQIIAFDVSRYALLLIAAGFGVSFLAKSKHTTHFGSMVMGLGLVFYGMTVMGEAMAPLGSYPLFLDLMVGIERPALGILVGGIFTALVRSSAATIGIAIVMASEGLVSLPAGIALAFGANIGTCITAILASLGKPTEARRAAVAHVLFNVLGVLIWVAFIDPLAAFVRSFSPSHPDLVGMQRLGAEVPRQIANAHTVFNVTNTLLLIGFTRPFGRLVEWLVPERLEAPDAPVKPKYLDKSLVDNPAVALGRVRLELGHIGEIVDAMMRGIRPALLGSQEQEQVSRIKEMDDRVDTLHERILEYLGMVRQSALSDRESRAFIAVMSAADQIESVADILATNLTGLTQKAENLHIVPSDRTREMAAGLFDTVAMGVRAAVAAIRDDDAAKAREVLELHADVNRHIENMLEHQAQRLGEMGPQRPEIFRVQMEIVDGLKRVYTQTKRIARRMLQIESSDQDLPEGP